MKIEKAMIVELNEDELKKILESLTFNLENNPSNSFKYDEVLENIIDTIIDFQKEPEGINNNDDQ